MHFNPKPLRYRLLFLRNFPFSYPLFPVKFLSLFFAPQKKPEEGIVLSQSGGIMTCLGLSARYKYLDPILTSRSQERVLQHCPCL